MMVSDSTARWARHSINEHMPGGELVVSISTNEFQGLPVEYSDELRSACHADAVSLDGESHQVTTFIFAIRRIWMNDWTWPSRTSL